jgi:MarR family 2-MHQ and catechol resistance regulon transcriptional repressor
MKPGRPESEYRYQALLQLLRTADVVWNASRVFFERWHITPSQFNVLNLLHSESSGLSQTELSRQLIMHRSNVTGLVDRLEKRGLVKRRDVAADRRAYRVLVTESGRRLLKQILPRYYESAERIWIGLSPRRVTELTTDLTHVAGKAQSIGAESQRSTSK